MSGAALRWPGALMKGGRQNGGLGTVITLTLWTGSRENRKADVDRRTPRLRPTYRNAGEFTTVPAVDPGLLMF